MQRVWWSVYCVGIAEAGRQNAALKWTLTAKEKRLARENREGDWGSLHVRPRNANIYSALYSGTSLLFAGRVVRLEGLEFVRVLAHVRLDLHGAPLSSS